MASQHFCRFLKKRKERKKKVSFETVVSLAAHLATGAKESDEELARMFCIDVGFIKFLRERVERKKAKR